MVVVTVAGSRVERYVDRPSVVQERLEAFAGEVTELATDAWTTFEGMWNEHCAEMLTASETTDEPDWKSARRPSTGSGRSRHAARPERACGRSCRCGRAGAVSDHPCLNTSVDISHVVLAPVPALAFGVAPWPGS